MPFWRLLLFSVVGFSVPVCLALVLAPLFFEANPEKKLAVQYVRARLEAVEEKPEYKPPVELAHPSFSPVQSAEEIDPRSNSVFIVSSNVRFSQLPEVGKRERLFFKYAIDKTPYPGWAIALRRWPGSIRPEAYWRDAQGNGGWYTFGDVSLSEGQWYTFTFVVEDGAALSMYVTPAQRAGGKSTALEAFIGGFSVEDVALPKSLDSLFIPPLINGSAQRSHPVESSEFFIAEVSKSRFKELEKGLHKLGAAQLEAFKKSELRLLLKPKQASSSVQS